MTSTLSQPAVLPDIPSPGSIVQVRGRECVTLPQSRAEKQDQVLRLRPLGGGDQTIATLFWPLEGSQVRPASFALTDPALSGSQSSALLLRDALLLKLRAGAGPFRCLGNVALEPRPYHLMPQGRWILSLQQGAAAAASIRVVFHHRIHPLDRQQLRPRSRMARLTAALAAAALATLRRLKPRAITGGWFGGIARAAADTHPQLGQLCCQGGELAAEIIVLLLLGQDERSGLGRPRQPSRFSNPGRRCAHHRWSLLEMRPGIKLSSRVQQS